jgi:aspartyl-tRNA(Asn)/glutamyl-tRNA(Gln) amidotransferase subunit A
MTRRHFAKLAAAAAFLPAASRFTRAAGSRPSSDDSAMLSIAEASRRIRSGALTSRQLTEACLARIAVYEPKLNAFITLMAAPARACADSLDAEFKAGKWRGPLHGIPIALKDLIDTAGVRTTGGSAVFAGRFPTEDATVVKRLRAAGAVIIGKANLMEFGMSAPYFGYTRNPWALDRYAGGSSSGSAAAVCAGLCPGALGTDTGGSIRGPASYCGIIGLKPTYGLVPLQGILKNTPSLDHCGPLTRTVEDAALLLGVLAGYDQLDITSVEHPREDYVAAMSQPVAGFRIGTPPDYFDHLDPEVATVIDEALRVLKGLTREVKEVALPSTAQTRMSVGVGSGASAAGAELYAAQEENYRDQASNYMLPDRRELAGVAADRGGAAADYVHALWKLQTLRRTIDQAFTAMDVVAVPTQKIPAPLIKDFQRGAYSTAPSDPHNTSNSAPFDIYGIPAISIPCGFTRAGLPVGLTLAGPHFSEGRLFALAQAIETATGWSGRRPPLTPSTAVPAV